MGWNTDNNKIFFWADNQNDFWRSWSNDAENSALHHRNKLHFTLYLNKKTVILKCSIFHNISVFMYYYFWLYKCSLGEHRLLK